MSNPKVIDKTICKLLALRPLKALRVYERGIANSNSPLIAERLARRFGDTMKLLVAATKVDSDKGLRELVDVFSTTRRSDQKRLLIAVVGKLTELGASARRNPRGREHARLEKFGIRARSLVLEGTLQQQFFCKLATRLGFKRHIPLPEVVVELVVVPMIKALGDVIHVGAEATRDSAIEGMGALLKLASREERPEDRFQAELPIADGRGDPTLNLLYEKRLERRRLMVLAVADADWRRKLLAQLEIPIDSILEEERKEARKRILADPENTAGILRKLAADLQTVLYKRSDLLRILPAVARQNEDAEIPQIVDLLCRATKPLVPRPDDPAAVLIAYARHQESVFRTIHNIMRREVPWSSFDHVVADAVRAIPRTMTGLPQVCNAQVRATVSILRTAIHVVRESCKKTSRTKDEIRPLFRDLAEPRPWLNLGIAEGCLRGLPDLLPQKPLHGFVEPALEALFRELAAEHGPDDLAAVHRKLIATSCFRRILIALADRVYERHLDREIEQATLDESNVDADLRLLLSEPTAKNVIARFQPEGLRLDPEDVSGRSDIAVEVITGIALEHDLLRKAGAMFQRWKELPPEHKVVLTRILASQMHSASRDAPEVARYQQLSRVFMELSTVAMPHDEAINRVWDVLSTLPPEAAEAADPDIQRFVEYRGRRRRAEGKIQENVEDLPGYVLAMISPEASDRIAGAIAREIDLNLRHDRDQDGEADFAEPLYQVMLRGPHESIFDHLMPRITAEHDRRMVELFRSHVHVVLHGKDMPTRELVKYLSGHTKTLLAELRLLESPTLTELAEALKLFGDLVSELDEHMWDAIQAKKLTRFFQQLDKLDALACQDKVLLPLLCLPLEEFLEKLDTLDNDPNADKSRRWQTLLTYRSSAHLISLQAVVKHYIDLPVRNFSARSSELANAVSAVTAIEQKLFEQERPQSPRRILLLALMAHLRDIFERTNRWYCLEPQRLIDENDKDGFWIVFALESDGGGDQLLKRISSWSGGGAENNRVINKQRETRQRIEHLRKTAGNEPPRFLGQVKRFEDFAVDWMSSDLDLEALWNALSERWGRSWRGRFYRVLFNVVTTPWFVVPAILLPFLWSVAAHAFNAHWVEGLGFWVVAAAIVAGAVWAVARLFKVVREKTQPPPSGEDGYLFRCMLPQLAGFIAAPMALIAKFDHSYEFPFTSSPEAMGLLLLLAFVTTRLYLEREVVDRDSSSAAMTPRERKKVTKVLGVTLAHAFGIAVLLSVIFADGHHKAAHEKKQEQERSMQAHERSMQAAMESAMRAIAYSAPYEKTPEPKPEPPPAKHVEHDHDLHDFMGVLPHQAFLDWCEFKLARHAPWRWVRKNGHLTYYPTIILSWTALGLFFGLVLEGIDKGEHLRRRGRKDGHS